MMEQMELDHKLGKDLMEKSVKRNKQKNIAEAGMDSANLNKYMGIQNQIQQLGGKSVSLARREGKLA